MKNIILMISVLSISAFPVYAETCKEKISKIETKIVAAKKNKNLNQVSGLETALAETRLHCTDGKFLQTHEMKVADKEADLKNAMAELNEAQAKNKSAEKIKEKQDKVNKKKKELEDLKLGR